MSDYSSNREVFGAKTLNAVIIFGAVAMLLASIIGPLPKAAVSHLAGTDRQVAEQVAAPGHHG